MKLKLLTDCKYGDKGEIVNVDNSEGEILKETDIATDNLKREVEDLGEIQDPFVESYTEWWKDIYNSMEEFSGLENDQLVEATNTILQEVGKCKRQEEIGKQKRPVNKNVENEATVKQYEYLDSLGVDYSKPLSKEEASNLIDREQDKEPATDKQKSALQKLGKWEKGLSKKEASDKLSQIYGD